MSSSATKQRREEAARRAADNILQSFKALDERLSSVERNYEELVALFFPPEMVERARAEQKQEAENDRDAEGSQRVRGVRTIDR